MTVSNNSIRSTSINSIPQSTSLPDKTEHITPPMTPMGEGGKGAKGGKGGKGAKGPPPRGRGGGGFFYAYV